MQEINVCLESMVVVKSPALYGGHGLELNLGHWDFHQSPLTHFTVHGV